MTNEKSHFEILAFLRKNEYFGFSYKNITLFSQA